jgi:hypothetical protein
MYWPDESFSAWARRLYPAGHLLDLVASPGLALDELDRVREGVGVVLDVRFDERV